MNRVKVLHVITHLGVGGALDNTLLTVQGLPRSRFEVHLAAGELCPDDSYSSWEQRSRDSADALFLFPEMKRPVNPRQDNRVIKQMTRLIEREKYDIVHTHCSKAGVIGRIAARRAGVPVVVHTCHAFGWQVARQPEASLAKKLASAAKQRLYLGVDRYAASISDALITVAELNKKDAVEHRLAPADKISTIYSGIDMSKLFDRAHRDDVWRQFGLDPSRPVLGTAGRLCTQKAPLDFVEAVKSVLQARPDIQVVMLGDGPMAREVEEAIGGESRITMLGFRENGPEIVGAMDIFALSSLWEGLGRALTEALIMGVPAAATDVDGIPELIKHGETGLLSPPGQPHRLAENILWLLEHPEEARKIGKQASERVTPMFSAQQMVDQIEALYMQLLTEKRASTKQVVRSRLRQLEPVLAEATEG